MLSDTLSIELETRAESAPKRIRIALAAHLFKWLKRMSRLISV